MRELQLPYPAAEQMFSQNDIVAAKVAHDPEKLYFYVETAQPLSSSSDRNWMMLFLDTDRNKATGWNGYDYVVNRISPTAEKVMIEKNVGNRWEWETIEKSRFVVKNNKLEIEILKQTLNLMDGYVDIEFKWNDNMQENGNIMDFYVNGDTAPGGRFNFVYKSR